MAGKRIINLGGGEYNGPIHGDSVNVQGNTVEFGGGSKAKQEGGNQTKEPRNVTDKTEVIDTGGRSYTETQNGVTVERIDT